MSDIYELISEEELTPDLQLLSELCGIEVVRKLLRTSGGMAFYIPKLSRLNNFISRYTKENRSKPRKVLAKELNVSEQYLKQYVK